MENKKYAMLETKINEVKLEILEHGLLTTGEEWNFSQVVSPFNRLYLILDGEGIIRKGGQKPLAGEEVIRKEGQKPLAGEEVIRKEGQKLRLKKGRAYLIPAGSCCDYRAVGYLKKLYIHFQIQLIPGLDLFGRCGKVLESEGLSEETTLLLEKIAQKGSVEAVEGKALLLCMISHFLRLGSQIQEMDQDYSGFEKQYPVISYVEQNLTAALRVDQVAEAVGASYFSLSRNFKQDTGMGLKEYMELLLMNRARRALATTDLRIGEIADQLGFGDAFYFTKFFHRYEKMSPREYRKRRRI